MARQAYLEHDQALRTAAVSRHDPIVRMMLEALRFVLVPERILKNQHRD